MKSLVARPTQPASARQTLSHSPAVQNRPVLKVNWESVDVEQLDLPITWIKRLYRHGERTNHEWTLFRVGQGTAEAYEPREGNDFASDSTILGESSSTAEGEALLELEERFFETEAVAHLHPLKRPGETNLKPQDLIDDLKIITRKARRSPGIVQLHSVLGYVGGQRGFIQLQAVCGADGRVEHSFRVSRNMPPSLKEGFRELTLGFQNEVLDGWAYKKAARNLPERTTEQKSAIFAALEDEHWIYHDPNQDHFSTRDDNERLQQLAMHRIVAAISKMHTEDAADWMDKIEKRIFDSRLPKFPYGFELVLPRLSERYLLKIVHQIEEKIADPFNAAGYNSDDVGFMKLRGVGILAHAAPLLDSANCLTHALNIVPLLNEVAGIGEALAAFVKRLGEPELAILAEKIGAQLSRTPALNALRALGGVIPLLRPDTRLSWVEKVEAYLDHTDNKTACLAAALTGELVACLPAGDRLARILHLERKLQGSSIDLKERVIWALGRAVPHLKKKDQEGRAFAIEKRAKGLKFQRDGFVYALAGAIPALRPNARSQIVKAIRTRLSASEGWQDYGDLGNPMAALEKAIPYLKPSDRVSITDTLIDLLPARGTRGFFGIPVEKSELQGKALLALNRLLPAIPPNGRMALVKKIIKKLASKGFEYYSSEERNALLKGLISHLDRKDCFLLASSITKALVKMDDYLFHEFLPLWDALGHRVSATAAASLAHSLEREWERVKSYQWGYRHNSSSSGDVNAGLRSRTRRLLECILPRLKRGKLIEQRQKIKARLKSDKPDLENDLFLLACVLQSSRNVRKGDLDVFSQYLNHHLWNVRQEAHHALAALIPFLPIQDRLGWTLKMASNGLSSTIPLMGCLSPEDRAVLAGQWIDNLHSASAENRSDSVRWEWIRTLKTALEEAVAGIHKESLPGLALQISGLDPLGQDSVFRGILRAISRHLSDGNRRDLMNRYEERFRLPETESKAHDWKEQFARNQALNAFNLLLFNLPPEELREALLKVADLVSEYNPRMQGGGTVGGSALIWLKEGMKRLPPEDCAALSRRVIGRLAVSGLKAHEPSWENDPALSFVKAAIHMLRPEPTNDRLDLVTEIERNFGESRYFFLCQLVSALDSTSLWPLVERSAATLASGEVNDRVLLKCAHLLKVAFPRLDARVRVPYARILVNNLNHRLEKARGIILAALCDFLALLNRQEVFELSKEFLPALFSKEHAYHAKEIMFHAAPHLGHKRAFRLAREILKQSDSIPQAGSPETSVLEKLIPFLNVGERVRLLDILVENWSVKTLLEIPFLALLLDQLPASVLRSYADSHRNEDLAKIALYCESSLPWTHYFWSPYVASPDPKAYIGQTREKLAAHRRGLILAENSEEDMQFSFAALDSAPDLSFEEYALMVRGKKAPPPAFLQRPFTAEVDLRRSLHQTIDKGKILQAHHLLDDVRQFADFKEYLTNLFKVEAGSLKGIKAVWEHVFPVGLEKTTYDEMLRKAPEILARIWNGDTMAVPAIERLAARLALFIGWHRVSNHSLKERMQQMNGEKIPSTAVEDVLKATEEFYRDALADVLREANIGNLPIPLIEQQRLLLKNESEALSHETMGRVPVEFVPSKSRSELVYAYDAEDCNKGKGNVIYREDFQVYRMIANERRVGTLYLQKAVLDGKKVLVLAVQPRSSWNVDHAGLLKAVEDHLSWVASQEGYDAVLFMNDNRQQSNRQDTLQAIRDRKYDAISFSDPVQGAVFNGNHFLVIWKKGMPVSPQAEPKRLPVPAVQPKPTEVPRAPDAVPVPLPAPQRQPAIRPVMIRDAEESVDLNALRGLFNNLRDAAPLVVAERRNAAANRQPINTAEILAALKEVGLEMVPVQGTPLAMPEVTNPELKPARALIRTGGPLIPYSQVVPPDTLVLIQKNPLAIFLNPVITRTDRGWIEPTLEGKTHVIETERGAGILPASGGEVTPQDLFDFYNIVFHQGLYFKAFLIVLKNRGADFEGLEADVKRLSRCLKRGIEALVTRNYADSLAAFQEVDGSVTELRAKLRSIANQIGLDVDPVTGMVSLLP